MKTKIELQENVLEGTEVAIANNTATVKGPQGELVRTFRNPYINLSCDGKTITAVAPLATKREKVAMHATMAHLRNMMIGAKEGFTYKLKICSGHFPMTVKVDKNVLTVKNFIGESSPRTLTLKEGAKVSIDGDIITVTGIDKERAGQVAADIEKICRRPSFDNRIFQDGIYITEKCGKTM